MFCFDYCHVFTPYCHCFLPENIKHLFSVLISQLHLVLVPPCPAFSAMPVIVFLYHCLFLISFLPYVFYSLLGLLLILNIIPPALASNTRNPFMTIITVVVVVDDDAAAIVFESEINSISNKNFKFKK